VVAARRTSLLLIPLHRERKYECVYLLAFENGTEARNEIGAWMKFYGAQRPHSALAGLTPDEVYADAARFSTNAKKQKQKKQQQKLAA
jgi:Integrase core domain